VRVDREGAGEQTVRDAARAQLRKKS